MKIEMTTDQQSKCLAKVCMETSMAGGDHVQIDKNQDGTVSKSEFIPTIRVLLTRLLTETGATVVDGMAVRLMVQGDKVWTEMWSTAVGTYWFHLVTGETTFENPIEKTTL
jgi:hypothetical protein